MADLLKNNVDGSTASVLATRFAAATPGFDEAAFLADIDGQLDSRELKDRVNLLADRIAEGLPSDYPTALEIVTAVAESGLDAWAGWPLCSFVERHGIDHPHRSLEAMPVLTRIWSCEFAIRPFLIEHPDLVREHLRRWVLDDDEAVRRLASEGTRPRLPWGLKVQRLIDDPSIGLEVVTALRNDESETVRRSVANHLNDLSRTDPDLVTEALAEWMSADDPVDDALVRHGLRTLVKQGHRGALSILGYTTEPEVDVTRFICEPSTVELGSSIELTADVTSATDHEQLLVVDFVIHHLTAAGTTSPKVFKGKNLRLAPGETVTLTKRRAIQTASTRTYHPGVHQVDLQISGGRVASTRFNLLG